jgi:hypothetical protein
MGGARVWGSHAFQIHGYQADHRDSLQTSKGICSSQSSEGTEQEGRGIGAEVGGGVDGHRGGGGGVEERGGVGSRSRGGGGEGGRGRSGGVERRRVVGAEVGEAEGVGA